MEPLSLVQSAFIVYAKEAIGFGNICISCTKHKQEVTMVHSGHVT